ncbi:MAG: M20/M25/M40 family metallo-hydrolase [Bdellovibrionales bacterium]|nr:M20/M25/M40 family metallo-hydrolase [Bdellovibrionales bacterium]
MKNIVLMLLLVTYSGLLMAEEPAIYLVPKSNFKYFGFMESKNNIIDQNDEFYLMKLTTSQIEQFSGALHSNTHSCGGAMFVGDEVKAGKSFKEIMKAQVSKEARTFSYPSGARYRTKVERVLNTFTKDTLQTELTRLTQFPNRNAKLQTGVDASQYIVDKVNRLAQENGRSDVTVTLIPTPNFLQSSVLVRLQGTDPSLPAVVVGGHFDTIVASIWGPSPNQNNPGADDDGSGSASVLQIITGVLSSGMTFKRDMYFVFYAAEEYGLYGSKAVAQKFVNEGKSVLGVLQFDMTGFNSPNDDKHFYFVEDNVNPELTQFTKLMIKEYLNLNDSNIGSTYCNYACSDHASWHRQGYPAAFPFEASFDNDNKLIHTNNDGLHVIDFERGVLFVKLGAAFMMELAEPSPN